MQQIHRRLRVAGSGHALFAATLIAVGALGLIDAKFGVLSQSVPKVVPGRETLAGIGAFITLLCGAGLFWPRTAPHAARGLLVYLLLWFLLTKVRLFILAPFSLGPYEDGAIRAVIIAGAWVLYARLAGDWDRQHLGFATGDQGRRIARVIYGVSMVIFGLAHFVYLELTAPLVPKWLGFPVEWSYFTGGAYIAAGVAVLSGVWVRLAVALSVFQIGMFTLLVWVPIVTAEGAKTDFQWSEIVVSWVLTVAAGLMLETYRDVPWLGVRSPWRR